MDWFDMGRSPINKGTYRYKSSWGAKPVQLYYTYLADKTEHIPHYFESKTLQLATTMWKKVPLPLTKMLGPKLIKGVL
jgi:hypothetical protein